MSVSLEYVAAKASRAVELVRAENLPGAIQELAIGVAYLADYLRAQQQNQGKTPEAET